MATKETTKSHVKMTIRLADIVADPAKNARVIMSSKKEETDKVREGGDPIQRGGASTIEGLAQMIANEGQLTPIIVSELPKGKWNLISGFRRVAAMTSLKRDTIDAIVVPVTDKDAAMINLIENEGRKNLTPYERARGFEIARKAGLTPGQIAARLGIAKTHVNNMLRVMDRLPAEILERWRRECEDKSLATICYTDTMIKWVREGVTKRDALAAFTEAMGAVEGKGKDGKGKGKGKGKSKGGETQPRMVKHGIATLALAEVRKSKDIAGDYKRGLIDALRFCMGEAESIGEIFPREEEDEGEDGEEDEGNKE